jgi:hypothetical protein
LVAQDGFRTYAVENQKTEESGMRTARSLILVVSLGWLAIALGCGGGGGGSESGSAGTGTVSMAMTDAKPLLPPGVTNCFVTIDEVLAHRTGGGWESLAMVRRPYTIDLLQFTDGTTSEFVPPVALPSGKYTQIRLSVVSARIRFDEDPDNEVEIAIPSENLKTDQNIDFDVAENAAVDITIDFDLSRSIVVAGAAANPAYTLKPVLHLVETAQAATIEGFIANSKIAGRHAVIRVIDSAGQEYTRAQVEKTSSDAAGNPLVDTSYAVFWLVPNQAYTVQINYNPGLDDNPAEDGLQDGYDDSTAVPAASDPEYPDGTLPPGAIFPLDFPLAN